MVKSDATWSPTEQDLDWIEATGRPASRQYARARSVRDRSGSIVTIVPSTGSASAIHSVE